MSSSKQYSKNEEQNKSAPPFLNKILDATSKLKFGSIVLTIHEGKVVQLDVTEKHRFSE